MHKISVAGTGYVGLVTEVVSRSWHQVTCADIDEQKLNKLKQGNSPIYEVGLKILQ